MDYFDLTDEEMQSNISPGPQINDGSTTAADLFAAAEKSMQMIDNVNSAWIADEAAYDDRIAKIKQMTGKDLKNPYRIKDWAEAIERHREGQPQGARNKFEEYHAQERELFEKYPQLKTVIDPEEDIRNQRRKLAREAELDLQRLSENYKGWAGTGTLSMFAGGMWGMLQDPTGAASTLIAPPAAWMARGKGILGLVRLGIFAGATNAAVEAALQPYIQSRRADLGLPYGVEEAAINVGMAGALGFGLDAGGRVIARSGRATGRALGFDVPRAFEDAPPGIGRPDGETEPGGRPPTAEEADEAYQAWRRENLDEETIKRADQGDPEAIRKEAEALGIDKDPAVRGLIDEIEDNVDTWTRTRIEGVDDGVGQKRLAEAIRAAENGAEPYPRVQQPDPKRTPLQVPQNAAVGRTVEIDGKQVSIEDIDLKTTEVDPVAFQFKKGGDAAGATGRMSGVERWDDLATGRVMVFERADGTRVIADGHQRRSLAVRLADQETISPGFVLKETDGWSVSDVRALAAKKNIQEGSGTAIDAAQIMRERPDIIDGSVPLNLSKLRTARSLARLSDEAFDAVVAGMINPKYAAQVADLVQDKGRHLGMLNELAELEPRTEQEARLLIGEMLTSDVHVETQLTLLGVESGTRSMMRERVAVLDEAIKQLRKDQRIFNAINREAARLEGAGNRIAADTNAAQADEAGRAVQVLEQLAQSRGVVSEWLSDAARSILEGKPKRQAADAFANRIKQTLNEDGLNGLMRVNEEPVARVDDPNGPEAMPDGDGLDLDLEPKTDDGKLDLALSAGGRRAVEGEVIGEDWKSVHSKLLQGKGVRIADEVVQVMEEEVVAVTAELPSFLRGPQAYVMTSAVPTRDGKKVEISFREAGGKGTHKQSVPIELFGRLRAAHINGRILTFASALGDVPGGVGNRPLIRSQIWHEHVHALFRRLDDLSPTLALTLGRIVDHIDTLKLLDMEFRDFYRAIGDPDANKVLPGTIRDEYSTIYKDRKDLDDLLYEEGVGHLIELRLAGHLRDDVELAPIRDELEALFGPQFRENETMAVGINRTLPSAKVEVDFKANPEGRDLQLINVTAEDNMGFISAYVDADNSVRISQSQLDRSVKGRGIGLKMYKALIDAALARGMVVKSDMSVSSSAARVYDRLEAMGYRVERAKVADSDSGFMSMEPGRAPFEITGGPEDGIRASARAMAEPHKIDKVGFYSGLYEAARTLKQEAGPVEDMLNLLRKQPGVKAGEFNAAGLADYFQGRRKITREEILERIELKRIQLDEVRYASIPPDRANNVVWADKEMTPQEFLDFVKQSVNAMHVGSRGVVDRELARMEGDIISGDYTRISSAVGELRTFAQGYGIRTITMQQAWQGGSTPRWQTYSVDPSNPTYGETILTTPTASKRLEAEYRRLQAKYDGDLSRMTKEEQARIDDLNDEVAGENTFTHSHWVDVHNPLVHIRHSLQLDNNGKQNFTVGELQSDWGQGLRGRETDTANLEEMKAKLDLATDVLYRMELSDEELVGHRFTELQERVKVEQAKYGKISREISRLHDEGDSISARHMNDNDLTNQFDVLQGLRQEIRALVPNGFTRPVRDDAIEIAKQAMRDRGIDPDQSYGYRNEWDYVEWWRSERDRLEAEVEDLQIDMDVDNLDWTGSGGMPTNPLVADTDTWVNLGLRKALIEAVRSGADYITIASGYSVDRTRMGAPLKGIKYAYDQMYPKKLREILKRIDKDAAKPERIDKLLQYGEQPFQRRNSQDPLEQIPFQLEVGAVPATDIYAVRGGSGFEVRRRVYDQSVERVTDDKGGPDWRIGGGEEIIGPFATREAAQEWADKNPAFGFTRFPITDKVRHAVEVDGLPMMALRPKVPEPPDHAGAARSIDNIVARLPEDVRARVEDRLVFKDQGDAEGAIIDGSLALANRSGGSFGDGVRHMRDAGVISEAEYTELVGVGAEFREALNIDGRFKDIHKSDRPGETDAKLAAETIGSMAAARREGISFGDRADEILDRMNNVADHVARAMKQHRVDGRFKIDVEPQFSLRAQEEARTAVNSHDVAEACK